MMREKGIHVDTVGTVHACVSEMRRHFEDSRERERERER